MQPKQWQELYPIDGRRVCLAMHWLSARPCHLNASSPTQIRTSIISALAHQQSL